MSVPTTGNAHEQAGIALRTAIETGNLEQAQQLLSAYGREVETSFRSILGEDRQIAVLANDTKRMFDWAREKVVAARMQAVADLDALHSYRSYLEVGRSGVKSWELDG